MGWISNRAGLDNMKERFFSGDKPILFLLIFNIVVFTGVFIYDYTRYGSQGSQEVIGSILYKSNTVKRKYDSEVVWKEIETGNSLQNRDTILTSENSQAKIRLLDGSEITIAENSMIFIDYLDNQANLEISAGGLQITRKPNSKENTSSLGIRSGDGVLKLVEGVVNVEKKKNQKTLEYSILSGSVNVDPSNPLPMLPKKSLDGFEKLFPVAADIQTTESLQKSTIANSSSSIKLDSSSESHTQKQNYDSDKVQKVSDPNVSKKNEEFKNSEFNSESEHDSRSFSEVKKQKRMSEELLRQEKEKRRREREHREQREFLRL
ncbi:sigma factor regulatory protein, FecR/PupR family [Leptospira borgpetersenii str. Noumea 25]|uniref:Sigma factor regulatory protein, FecR/PupR family n=2 Tax=Leptospira borgpetersenii TaxID=174 RepID=A0A0S2IUH6_LEPBO|nr:sigma factor regulatory protein, FecR/PupR family [Leptospira borgpetersenii serovar Ballum]EMO09307.1 sigma factor regulatory protein, FecR/PupR family [Leptospira borgpetersenii str. Noumea 25]